MGKVLKIILNGSECIDCEEGTTYREIAETLKDKYDYDIIGVKADNDYLDLSDTIKKSCNLEFFDRSSHYGNTLYLRSTKLMLILAIRNTLGKSARVIFEHAQDGGIYCTISNKKIDDNIIKDIEKEMHNISEQDYNFIKLNVSRMDAIKYFKKDNRMDKVNALKYISNTYITLYRINDFYDYFYGKMAYSTSQINDFKLIYISDNGFVLSVPEIDNPKTVKKYTHHKLTFEKFQDYTNWGRKIGIVNASDLNQTVSRGEIGELVNLSEAYYDGQLSKIADIIASGNRDIKIILLAGPSSSGKTTTAKKLSIYLRSKGFITHPLSIDDYFVDREKTPKDENGEYDFESLDCVDTKMFNEHLTKLLKGEEVTIPTYNFVLGKREYHNKLKLKDKDIIVIEGLHALNDKLTSSIKRENKFKIFIAPLTQLNIDDHNYIHTSDIRKLRRIIRDSRTRGKTAEVTLEMWWKVSKGETTNIYPFQDDVDMIVNSALLYEICVLKTYVEPLLYNVDEDSYIYPEALRLINFLRNFLPMSSDLIPSDSVLREFIGGSCFKN